METIQVINVTNLFFSVITVMISSIIPAITAGVASNAEFDETFKSYFMRADARTYFTDEKLSKMREKYTKEYKHRFRYLMSLIIVWFALIYSISIFGSSVPDSQGWCLGPLLSMSYILCCSYLAGLAGASSGRLNATRPLMDWQRDDIRKILVTSPYSSELLLLINSNPKKQLAQVDYLHMLHVNKELDRRENKKMAIQIEKEL